MSTKSIQQTQFITLAIGATAQRMGITATELHNRLKQHGLNITHGMHVLSLI